MMKKGILVFMMMASLFSCQANKGMTPQMRIYFEDLSEESKKKFLEMSDLYRMKAINTPTKGCKVNCQCKEKAVTEQYLLFQKER